MLRKKHQHSWKTAERNQKKLIEKFQRYSNFLRKNKSRLSTLNFNYCLLIGAFFVRLSHLQKPGSKGDFFYSAVISDNLSLLLKQKVIHNFRDLYILPFDSGVGFHLTEEME